MAFLLSNLSKVLIGNADHTSKFTSYDVPLEKEFSDVTTLADTGRRWSPGLKVGKVSLAGLFDSGTGGLGVDNDLFTALGVDNGINATIAPGGLAIGARVWTFQGDTAKYNAPTTVADMVKTAVDITADDGVEAGVSLHLLASEAASTTSVGFQDTSASTASGGVLMFHSTVNTRSANFDLKVQYSTDSTNGVDGTWVDVNGGSITTLGAGLTGSQYKLCSQGVVIGKWLRAVSTLTAGTGAITYTVSFARRFP